MHGEVHPPYLGKWMYVSLHCFFGLVLLWLCLCQALQVLSVYFLDAVGTCIGEHTRYEIKLGWPVSLNRFVDSAGPPSLVGCRSLLRAERCGAVWRVAILPKPSVDKRSQPSLEPPGSCRIQPQWSDLLSWCMGLDPPTDTQINVYLGVRACGQAAATSCMKQLGNLALAV